MQPIIKSFPDARFDFEPGERSLIAYVTTERVDRDREVVVARGIDLAEFRKNPVVMFAHQYDHLPIGKCLWIKLDQDRRGLVAKTQFATTPFATDVFKLYQEGVLQGFSIGFGPDPQAMGPPTEQELKAWPAWAGARSVIRRSTLYEYSVAPVQANPDAVAIAVNKGLCSPQTAGILGLDAAAIRIEHLTARALEASVLAQAAAIDVDRLLGRIKPERIVRDCLDRARGRV